MKEIKTFDKLFRVSLIIFLSVMGLICFFPVLFTQFSSKYGFTSIDGYIGDTIGGIMGPFVAIAAAGLTFLAFWVQFKANEQQKQDIKDLKDRGDIEKLEAKFFEMIKLHRDNVAELTYTTKKIISKVNKSTRASERIEERETANARKVFKVIFYDFKELNKELSHFFENVKEENLYEADYLKMLRENITLKARSIDLVSYAKLDILYCILYFGLSTDDQETLKNFFIGRYLKEFYDPIIYFAALKPKKESEYWDKWEELNSKEISLRLNIIKYFKAKKNNEDSIDNKVRTLLRHMPKLRDLEWPERYDKYYGGHQFRLGHYFRHLYQSVTFVDQSKIIDYNQKYSNIKLLRGQLSTFEQSIFFLNSISILGRVWEFEDRANPQMAIEIKDQLITKYNFITNILSDKINDTISVSHFYPDVDYEAIFNPKTKEKREQLKKQHYQVQLNNTQNEN